MWNVTTFADGSSSMRHAGERLMKECSRSEVLLPLTVGSLDVLGTEDPRFIERHGAFISRTPTILGSGIWKPRTVLGAARRLNEGELLVYLDAGCTVRPGHNEWWQEMRDLVQENVMVATQLDAPHFGWLDDDFSEHRYTKVFTSTELVASDEVMSSPQCQSGMIFMKVCEETIGFLELWRSWMEDSDYALIDDSPSPFGMTEHADFVCHRHDQSVFSILFKQAQFKSISDFSWHAPDWFISGRNSPIWANRWRTGKKVSPLSPRFLKNFAGSSFHELRRRLS